MKSRLLSLILLFAVLTPAARAASATTVSWLANGSVNLDMLGTFVPLLNTMATVQCPANMLIGGVRIDHSGSKVTGIALICRAYGQIGATDTNTEHATARVGQSSSNRTRLDCPSGGAVSGLRGQENGGGGLIALTISCAQLSPDYQTIVNYINDPNLGKGTGALVPRFGLLFPAGSPLGGSGGNTVAANCPPDRPFLASFTAMLGVSQMDGINGACVQVVTKRLATQPPQPDLAARTTGQRHKAFAGDSNSFAVQIQNLGAPVSSGGNLYFDLIYNTSDILFATIAPGCATISNGRLRCPLSAIGSGGANALMFTIEFLRDHPNTPVVVVQASYDVDDGDLGNNTYGFATEVVRPF